MTQPFLILHKVRGQPAFDIAEQCEIDGEAAWVVSTSGHRAYPVHYWPLSQLERAMGYTELGTSLDEVPDHYSAKSAPSIVTTTASALLAKLGLTKPIQRRKL